MKRQIERNGALLRVLYQIALAVLEARALPGLHVALAQRLRRVGNHRPEIDAEHAAEAAAGLAGAERRIEGERRRGWFRIMDVAIRAMQVRGIAPDRKIGVRARFFRINVDPPLPDPQSGFQRFDDSRSLGRRHSDAVLDDLEAPL